MLGRLPLELADLYHAIYERIIVYEATTGKAIINNVLKRLLCARTRLPSSEFRKAISINMKMPLERLTNEHILDLLNNFVVFDSGLDMFRFAHLSVREFLEESRQEYSVTAFNAVAAEVCLIDLVGSSKSPSAARFLERDHGLVLGGKVSSVTESCGRFSQVCP